VPSIFSFGTVSEEFLCRTGLPRHPKSLESQAHCRLLRRERRNLGHAPSYVVDNSTPKRFPNAFRDLPRYTFAYTLREWSAGVFRLTFLPHRSHFSRNASKFKKGYYTIFLQRFFLPIFRPSPLPCLKAMPSTPHRLCFYPENLRDRLTPPRSQ